MNGVRPTRSRLAQAVHLLLVGLLASGALLVQSLTGPLVYRTAYRLSRPNEASRLAAHLRRADQLFADGRYYAALQRYTWLDQQRPAPSLAPPLRPPLAPRLALRLGIVRAVRGEFALAERPLWRALVAAPDCVDYRLTALYLGHVLASRGDLAAARQVWQRGGPCKLPPADQPHAGPQQVLAAEWALRTGDRSTAEQGYRAAFALALPRPWRALAAYRLALLQAAHSPAAARTILAAPPPSLPAPPTDPFVRPLLPLDAPDLAAASGQLHAVLRAPVRDQAQLLGQFYLDRGFPDLAAQQFEQVQPDSPHALAAATHLAYANWQAGKTTPDLADLPAPQAGSAPAPPLQVLTRLVGATPATTPTVTTPPTATATLTVTPPLTTTAPLALHRADTHLLQAAQAVQQRDYVAASSAYRQALALAPVGQRGPYALLVARFHLATAYALCEDGLAAARIATQHLPDDPAAWTALAASSYQCGDFASAAAAARRAQTGAPRADASFYLGAALARSGSPAEARRVLIRAADLAPASLWRVRAEYLLRDLGT